MTHGNPEARILTKNLIGIRKRYLDEVFRPAHDSLRARAAPIVEHVSIAGMHICLTFWSPRLRQKLAPALAHATCDPILRPALTIHLWDSASTGVPLALPYKNPAYVLDAGPDERVHIADGFLGTYVPGEEFMNLYDTREGVAYFWVPDADTVQGWLAAAPARTLFHWFLGGRGMQLVHAACVGSDGRAVLLAAKSGSGKSTTALACVRAGMEYLADDYVVVDVENAEAHSLYSSLKVAPERADAIPELAGKSILLSPTEKKQVVFLGEAFSERIRPSAKLAALMVPVIGKAAETGIVPAKKRDALLALAPTTLFQLPLAREDSFSALADLVKGLPCYFLMLGPDPDEVPARIRAFLEESVH